MARKHVEHHESARAGQFRWHSSRIGARNVMRLEEIRRERGFYAPSTFANGQILAGTGALVFEGELLQLPRKH